MKIEKKEEMVTVVIEETVVEEFLVPKSWVEDDLIGEKYHEGELVLEPGECQSVQYKTRYADGSETSWLQL